MAWAPDYKPSTKTKIFEFFDWCYRDPVLNNLVTNIAKDLVKVHLNTLRSSQRGDKESHLLQFFKSSAHMGIWYYATIHNSVTNLWNDSWKNF